MSTLNDAQMGGQHVTKQPKPNFEQHSQISVRSWLQHPAVLHPPLLTAEQSFRDDYIRDASQFLQLDGCI